MIGHLPMTIYLCLNRSSNFMRQGIAKIRFRGRLFALEMWPSVGNSLWTVTELAEVQPDPLQRMAFALTVAPSSLELNPVLLEGSALNIVRVYNLRVLPRGPGHSKSIDVVQSWHTNEPVLARRRPQSMRTTGRK